jgi:Caspase domain
MYSTHSGKFFSQSPGKGIAGMLFFLASIFFCQRSTGQSYFFLENKVRLSDSTSINYATFLILEQNGTASARIRYEDPSTGDSCLVELSMADSINTGISVTDEDRYLVVAGSPRYIRGINNTGFALPRIIFKKEVDGNNSFYYPYAAEFKGTEGIWAGSEMILILEKSLTDLPKEPKRLLPFYKPDEAFFKYVFTPLSRGPSGITRKEKLFLVVVANTTDSSIGLSSKKDLDNVTKTFTGLAKDLGMEVIATYISGDGFSKKAVEKAISKPTLNPSPIDIVVFYYSGHGFRYADDTSKYPRISLRTSPKMARSKSNLSIEEIYQQIVKLGAKVNIVLSDCCNENIGIPRPVGKDILGPRGSETWPGKINMDNCNALLFPEKQVSILVGSAEINQLASGNPSMGGFFTAFFRAELEKTLYGYQSSKSWKNMLLSAKEKARKQALTAVCGDGRCVQRAEIRIVPEQ